MARQGGGSILRRQPSSEASRGGLFRFLGEVISELKKVTWPTPQETVRLTLLVIAVSVVIGTALGLIDILFTELLDIVLS